MFENINWGKKVIKKYIDFDYDEKKSLSEQEFLLKEDIIQIVYEKKYILDIGWYPEFEINGAFRLLIIKNSDWETPFKKYECKDIDTLLKYLDKFIDFIQKDLE